MTAPAHTPTPWNNDSPSGLVIFSETERVATVDDLGSSFRTKEMKANAAFIVRAVNSHDDLLITLKSLRKAVSQYLAESVASDIDAAIAKAEGK